MNTESTVLLVSTREVPAHLPADLEAAGVFVETTGLNELSQVFEVTCPDLIVHWGAEGFDDVAVFAAKGPEAKRVRMVVVAERSKLSEVRKANRSVVASVLADDMPGKALVERIVSLARRSSQNSQVVANPLVAAKSISNGARPLAITRPPARAPLTQLSSLRPTPSLARQPEVRADQRPLFTDDDVTRIATVNIPTRSKTAPPTTATRIALVDDDVTRGAALAAALQERGFVVQLYPHDPERTRWALLRSFAPEAVVVNSAAEKPVWLELLRADAHLQKAEVIPAAYDRLFDENSGRLHMGSLLAHLTLPAGTSSPHASGDSTQAAAPGFAPLGLGQGEGHRNQLSSDSGFASVEADEILEVQAEDDEENRPTLVVDTPDITWGEGPPPPALPGGSVRPTPPRPPRPSNVPFPETAAVGSAPLKQPKRGRRAILLTLVALAAVGAVGGFLWQKNNARRPTQRVASGPAIARPLGAPRGAEDGAPAPAATPGAGTAAAAAVSAPRGPADLWTSADDPASKTCEEQIGHEVALPKGDVAQSIIYWDRARDALVLGDVGVAQINLCRAVFIHSKTFAVEALAETYVNSGSPRQAKRWVEEAMINRPGRPKTLELLGDVESRLGHVEEARKAWAQALHVPADDQKKLDAVAKQQVVEGQQALRAGSLVRAETLFRRAAGLSPINTEAAEGLSRVFGAQNKPALAQLWLDEAKARATLTP